MQEKNFAETASVKKPEQPKVTAEAENVSIISLTYI